MKDKVYIDGALPQWKGNLHLHTTRSDGTASPEEAMAYYKNAGYHFCVISDHEIYWDSDALDSENFIVLPGVESGIEKNPNRLWEVHGTSNLCPHIHAIRDAHSTKPSFAHDQSIPRLIDTGVSCWQKQVDYLRAHGNFVILNHPRWSRLEPEQMLSMDGYFAVEVYNHCSEVLETTGESEYEWDYCLRRGKRVWAVAADDNHDYAPEAKQCFGGFTMVSAPALTREALSDSFREGSFYASSGPVIHDMRVENGTLYMDFSEAQAVRLVASQSYAPTLTPPLGQETFTHIEWKLRENLRYVRPEVIGPTGRKAWGQPIFYDEEAYYYRFPVTTDTI
ncbi:MAG: hypothetical protein ACI4PD_05600 [Butyricicoccus sp.]